MKAIKPVLILALLLITFISNAKAIVYRTYEDFANKTGEEYDDCVNAVHVGTNVTVHFKKDGDKVKIPCKEMWGFSWDGLLFRTDTKYNMPALVMSVGKIVHYENGWAHFTMKLKDDKTGDFSIGYPCYVSKDINSEMVPIPGMMISDARKKIKVFRDANPQYSELFDCIDKNFHYLKVRKCVQEFEGN